MCGKYASTLHLEYDPRAVHPRPLRPGSGFLDGSRPGRPRHFDDDRLSASNRSGRIGGRSIAKAESLFGLGLRPPSEIATMPSVVIGFAARMGAGKSSVSKDVA